MTSHPKSDRTPLEKAIPRLQIVDASSSSKPDNYRISPASKEPSKGFQSVWEDWSGRGQGSHVDFLPNEVVPLKEGRFLGHGVMGGVYETIVSGQAFAWKRRFCRRAITDLERKEIEILKKLDHKHIIKLVGTYTHRQFLGLLLHPVAVCDLATFLEDFDMHSRKELNDAQRSRLQLLGLPTNSRDDTMAKGSIYIYSKIGCLVKAVEYLHDQKFKHKDLKPSNVLLSARGLWLTDFGTATDFSMLSTSATENYERGTPKYFAPEVAQYAPSGRAADIFSLGCILLEITIICLVGNLQPLVNLRPDRDRSYQANINRINEWLSAFYYPSSPRAHHLLVEIRRMLSVNPQDRPSATEVGNHLALLDGFKTPSPGSLFGDCCRTVLMTVEEHDREMSSMEQEYGFKIDNMKNKHFRVVGELEGRIAKYAIDDENTKISHMRTVDEMVWKTNAYITEIGNMKAKYTSTVEEHKRDVKLLEEKHQLKIAVMDKEHMKTVSGWDKMYRALEKKYQSETSQAKQRLSRPKSLSFKSLTVGQKYAPETHDLPPIKDENGTHIQDINVSPDTKRPFSPARFREYMDSKYASRRRMYSVPPENIPRYNLHTLGKD